jgi:hypothetical protein
VDEFSQAGFVFWQSSCADTAAHKNSKTMPEEEIDHILFNLKATIYFINQWALEV